MTGAENCDVSAVGFIAMELMQKYRNDDRVIGIEEEDRWPANSRAVAFLSKTVSTIRLEDLAKVRASLPIKRHLFLTLLAFAVWM